MQNIKALKNTLDYALINSKAKLKLETTTIAVEGKEIVYRMRFADLRVVG